MNSRQSDLTENDWNDFLKELPDIYVADSPSGLSTDESSIFSDIDVAIEEPLQVTQPVVQQNQPQEPLNYSNVYSQAPNNYYQENYPTPIFNNNNSSYFFSFYPQVAYDAFIASLYPRNVESEMSHYRKRANNKIHCNTKLRIDGKDVSGASFLKRKYLYKDNPGKEVPKEILANVDIINEKPFYQGYELIWKNHNNRKNRMPKYIEIDGVEVAWDTYKKREIFYVDTKTKLSREEINRTSIIKGTPFVDGRETVWISKKRKCQDEAWHNEDDSEFTLMQEQRTEIEAPKVKKVKSCFIKNSMFNPVSEMGAEEQFLNTLDVNSLDDSWLSAPEYFCKK